MRGLTEPTGLRAQGAISVSARGGWRLGRLALADAALTFSPPGKRGAVRIGLESITRVDVERRTFVVSAKRVIKLTYLPGMAHRPCACWVITADLGAWESALRRAATGRRPGCVQASGAGPAAVGAAAARAVAGGEVAGGTVGGGGLPTAFAGLAGPARRVLDYLARRGPATTAELMALTGVETEEALPGYLHEQFRPLEHTLGGAVIRYAGTQFDQRSGEVRHQSWRAEEVAARRWLAATDPADVIVEDRDVLVLATLPTRERGTVPSVVVAPDGRGLTVSGAHGCGRWIDLPEEVAGKARVAVAATGTLVVRVRRKEPAVKPGRKEPATGRRGRAAPAPAAHRSPPAAGVG